MSSYCVLVFYEEHELTLMKNVLLKRKGFLLLCFWLNANLTWPLRTARIGIDCTFGEKSSRRRFPLGRASIQFALDNAVCLIE